MQTGSGRWKIGEPVMVWSSTVVSSLAICLRPVRVSSKEYDLFMRVDTNTNGHMQWFYFNIRNQKKTTVKLNIFRFRKRYSLFQRGLKPYVKSRRSGKDWLPGGEKVRYLRQCIYNQNGVKCLSNYYYLTFQYTFEHDNDEVYFAACIPYTTTFLNARIASFQQTVMNNQRIKLQVTKFCTTLCGQQLELLSIQPRNDHPNHGRKQFIIINARSHSGESSSSWVADGLISTLLQDPDVQDWMVNLNICFRIVPMLNKDGVFIGNYRTGIVGDDFNRKFSSGQREFFPEISALKRLVGKCKKQGSVKLFLDLHGHSILKNSFIFGPDRKSYQNEELIRLGDLLLENSKYFSRVSSYYKNQKAKIQTARVFFQMQEEILSLTCENSLGLFTEQYQTFQETAEDWRTFGNHIVYAMRQALSDGDRSKEQHLVKKYSENLDDKSKSRTKKNTTWSKQQIKKVKPSLPPSSMNSICEQRQQKQLQVMKKTSPVHPNRNTRQTSQNSKGNNTVAVTPWRMSRQNSMQQRPYIEPKLQQQALQKSIVLTRYREIKHTPSEQTPTKRTSKTSKAHYSFKQPTQMEQIGQQQLLPDNFSEEYVSINDSDSQSDDMDPSKREQLFKCIKELNYGFISQDAVEQALSRDQLLPLKGFKQYKLNFQQQIVPIVEKKPASKLKPLKFQQFKMRGYTEKKIKSNLDILFTNNSLIASERDKARFLVSKNELLSKKNQKREELIAEIFPQKEESEYLMMRIKEMTLQNGRESDK